jgi:hypothetical protein
MKNFLTLVVVFAILIIPVFFTSTVSAQLGDPLEKTCEAARDSGGTGAEEICAASANPEDPTGDGGIIVKAANLLAVVAGIIAVFIMIVSGITMMTSGGDPSKVTKARNTIIYVAIGLVVIILSRTIVVFVVTRFTQ